MITKTDRIIGYLPPTFRALPRPTALYPVIDAFGTQLLEAESSLGAVMLSHWADYADRGSEFITDLNCFAALYGLAPRGAAKDVAQFASPTCAPVSADESVEEFREHLKRYVRTFIEGPVTVQGVLRVVSEALGVHIADDYASMDSWWTREPGFLTTTESSGDSVARQLFGVTFAKAQGSPASSAQVIGRINLEKGIELHGASRLRLRVDDAGPVDIDLNSIGAGTTLDRVIATINKALSQSVASNIGGRLRLASATFGANSRLEVLDLDGDAAPALLGLLPRTYTGKTGRAATLTGHVDLSHGADLRARSLIQVRIDAAPPVTVDCAGVLKAKTGLTEIVDAINKAVRTRIARQDGKHVILVSPTTGLGSSIRFMPLGAGDATEDIFGIPPRIFQGAEATAARITGSADLSGGLDVRAQHRFQVSVDGGPQVEVDLWTAAEDPKNVSPTNIRHAINRALGAGVASDDGRYLFLNSTLTGSASSIAIGPVTETQARRFVTRAYITDEAAPVIFGFLNRIAIGSAAAAASLLGAVDLSGGVDLHKNHHLRIVVNDRSAKEVDLARGIVLLRGATLPEIVNAINAQMGFEIASQDGHHLILTSPKAAPVATSVWSRQRPATRGSCFLGQTAPRPQVRIPAPRPFEVMLTCRNPSTSRIGRLFVWRSTTSPPWMSTWPVLHPPQPFWTRSSLVSTAFFPDWHQQRLTTGCASLHRLQGRQAPWSCCRCVLWKWWTTRQRR